MFYLTRICFSLIGLTIFSAAAFGQDLGSSNGLFRSPNPVAKKTSAKPAPSAEKKTVVRKPVAAKSREKETSKAASKTVTNRANARTAAKIRKSSEAKTKQVTRTKTGEIETGNAVAVDSAPPKNGNVGITPANDYVITVGQPAVGDFDEQFEKAIDEGNQARDERNYAKAETAYLRAQSLRNGDSRAIYGLGNLYSDQQRWEEAERAYRTSIQLDPSAPESYTALSFVLTQPIQNADLPARYIEAEKAARTAVKLDPANATTYDQLGVSMELRGVIGDETENAYRRAIQLDSQFALAYAHLGRLLRRQGDLNGSSGAYRSAIQFSNDVPTMILVADVMQSQQRYLESEQLLRRALKTDPKNPTALFLLGRALTTRGSYDEAESVLKKSADVSPNSFVSYMLLGSMYARQGKLGDAEGSLKRALKVVSTNEKKRLAQEFENIGDAYTNAGKPKDAVRLYRQAHDLDLQKAGLNEKIAKSQS